MDDSFFSLKYNLIAPHIWETLSNLKRTGWVNRGVANPETVAEHTVAARNIVLELWDQLSEFSEQDRLDILDMLEIHDWPEALHGDEAIVTDDPTLREQMLRKKLVAEHEAMSTICQTLGTQGKHILHLWERFEAATDPVATFAKQVDKYQAMEKALEYETTGAAVSAQEFIDYDSAIITHPLLRFKIQELQQNVLPNS